MPICVLTGDIVSSTALSFAKRDLIRRILTQANDDLRSSDRSKPSAHLFDLHRGDGWQAAFTAPQMALRFALYFRAALRGTNETFATRIALATGVEKMENSPIESNNSATFIASGHALDLMSSDHLMAHAQGGALHAATVLADHISRDWTPPQARAIAPFLHPTQCPTQKDVAQTLGISRQAVGQALDAAGYPALKSALTAIEAQVK